MGAGLVGLAIVSLQGVHGGLRGKQRDGGGVGGSGACGWGVGPGGWGPGLIMW